MIEIVILFERLSIYRESLKRFVSNRPYLVSFLLFFFCNLINLSNLFAETPILNIEEEKTNEKTEHISLCVKTSFTFTFYGKIIMFISFILKDCLLLLIETFMSLYLISLNASYLKDKLDKCKLETSIQSTQIESIDTNPVASEESVNLDPELTFTNNQNNQKDTVLYKDVKNNSMLTKISINLSLLSCLSHFSILVAVFFFFVEHGTMTAQYAFFTSKCLLMLKYVSNFFVFFYYNHRFRKFVTSIFMETFRKT